MLMKLSFALLLAFIMFENVYAQNATIEGYVFNAASQPISEATVLIESNGKFETTNGKGYFKFQNLREGNYTLTFFATDYKTQTQTFFLKPDENKALQIQIQNLEIDLNAITVSSNTRDNYGLQKLNNVE